MAARRVRHLSSCETYLDAELGVVQRRMGVPDSGCVLLGDRYARRRPLVLRATSGRHELDSNVLHGPSLGPVPRAERPDSPRLEYLQRMERAERHPGEFHPGLVHPLVDLHLDGPPQALYPHLTALYNRGNDEHIANDAWRYRRSRQPSERTNRPRSLQMVQPGSTVPPLYVLFGLVRRRMAAPHESRVSSRAGFLAGPGGLRNLPSRHCCRLRGVETISR